MLDSLEGVGDGEVEDHCRGYLSGVAREALGWGCRILLRYLLVTVSGGVNGDRLLAFARAGNCCYQSIYDAPRQDVSLETPHKIMGSRGLGM